MTRIIYLGIIVFGNVFFNFLTAQITTLVYQPDGITGVDNVINSLSSTTNYSTSITFEASRNSSNVRTRSQLYFNLSSLPSTAIVYSAKLSLYGIAHTGTANACYLAKNTSSWTENAITWSTMPLINSTGQLSLTQSTTVTQNYTLDVKAFVQDMINIPAANFGWTLMKQNEGTDGALVFASSDYSNASQRPKLEISYSIPMSVQPYMIPSTGTATANGALYLNITSGVTPYTYLWSDGSTNKDLINKIPGVYSFTVTDNVGSKVKKDYIISAEGSVMTFTLMPDGLAGKDAVIQLSDNGSLANNNNANLTQNKAERGTAGAWFKTRSLLSFDLACLPTNAIVSTASVTLYGNGHNPLSQPNSAKLYVNTSSWDEPTLTWNTQPSHTTSNSVLIAPTTYSNENRTLDVSVNVQSWIQNPSSNYGWKMMLDDELSQRYSFLVFGSSDHATLALRPILFIAVMIPPPYQYAILRKKLDGNFYQTVYGVLAFKFDEEYVNNGVGLEYKIYDANRNVVLSNLSPGASLNTSYKDNRFRINLLNLIPTLSGYYVLEVKDRKGDISMLRFKI